jgi:hypothetical protein
VRLLDERNGRVLRGILQGCEDVGGRLMLRVQVTRAATNTERKAGNKTYLVCPENAYRVTLAEGETWRLPGAQMGRSVSADCGLAAALVGHGKALRLVMCSACDCAIVGEATILRREIVDTPVATIEQGAVGDAACLQDVLRVREFCGVGQPYRSRSISSTRSRRRALPRTETAYVVIFDGPTGFLKQRDRWPSSGWVVILDRTHRLFDAAVESLNEAYSARRMAEPDMSGVGEIPPGIEMVAYEERLG